MIDLLAVKMQSKCIKCGNKKSRFAKEQDGKVLLTNLGKKNTIK